MKKFKNFFIGLLVGAFLMFAIDFFWEKEIQKDENPKIENEAHLESDTIEKISKVNGHVQAKVKSDTVKKGLKKVENTTEKIQTEAAKVSKVPFGELVEGNPNETSIAKDEFLGSKRILVKQDSIETMEFLVEFWVSPINYKGYKRNDKRIVVFGFNMDSELKLLFVGDSLWLEHKNQRFLLKKSQEFHRFSSSKNSVSKNMAYHNR